MKAEALIQYFDEKRRYIRLECTQGIKWPVEDMLPLLDWSDRRKAGARIRFALEDGSSYQSVFIRRPEWV